MIPHETRHGPHRTADKKVPCGRERLPRTQWLPLRLAARALAHVSHRCPGNPFRGPRAPPLLPHARPATSLAPRGRPCARSRSGRQHALLPPARPAAARTPHSRPRAQPPPARPAADAAHTPRCRLRALQSAATLRGRPCAPWPCAPWPPARPAAAARVSNSRTPRAPVCRPHAGGERDLIACPVTV